MSEETKYMKINTLWKRDQKGKIMPEQITCPEFKAIKKFHVTEKIHGRNTRVEFDVEIKNGRVDVPRVNYYGKTKDAEFKPEWYEYMMDTFNPIRLTRMINVRKDKKGYCVNESYHVTLYGELFGEGVQKGGGNYCKEPKFALFDVRIGDWWLEQENVTDIANKLDIPIAPFIGYLTLEEIIEHVKNKPKSKIAEKDHIAEGVVARSEPLMMFRNGTPIIFKLKVKDFKDLIE